jgi:glycosyltransferase involved in cell wall biosynthesis
MLLLICEDRMSQKILHVIARMNVGGTAHYISQLVENMPNSFLATGVVQGSEIEDPCVKNLEIMRIPHMGRSISPIRDLIAFFELRKVIHLIQPDILHTHTFKAGLLARLIRGKHKRVHTFHGHLFEDMSFSVFDKYLILFVEKFLAKRTDLLISVGIKVGTELRAMGVGQNRKWKSIPPGVEPLPKIHKEVARHNLGLPNGVFIVGWMARVTSVKNPYLVIDIAKQLPQIQFVMAGGGDLLESIRDMAPKNLMVVGWTNASEFCSAIDCLISTSDNEGMPVALIEAQLAQVPVIATDVGSNSEVIENGVTGFIVKKNVTNFLTALRLFEANEAKRTLMGGAGETRAKEFFGTERMLKAHIQSYKDL